jgi:lysophospholipase
MNSPSASRRAHPEAAQFSAWPAPDGWSHRRMHWPQPARGGRAEARGTLLFASGRGDFIEKYLEPMAHWHGERWQIESFDWRGQGASRGELAGHLESMDVLVDDLEALIADLAQAPRPLVAIGHSMGGHVLLRAIADKRVKVDAAVLVAPMLSINSAPLPPWAAWWTASAFANFGWRRHPVWRTPAEPKEDGSSRQSFLTGCPDRYADELWWWRREPGFNIGAPSWGWLEAAYRSCAALTEAKLRAIDTHVLLVGTEADRLVGADAIRRAASLIPGARLKMFKHAAHELLREADPVRLEALAAIDDFLAGAAPA